MRWRGKKRATDEPRRAERGRRRPTDERARGGKKGRAPAAPAPGPPRNSRVAAGPGDARVGAAPRAARSAGERLRGLRAFGRRVGEKLRRPVAVTFKIVLVVAVAAGTVSMARLVERHVRTAPAFATSEIVVEGNGRLSREAVLEAAGLAEGRNVFDVAPEVAEAALRDSPWIAEAQVRRQLPGRYEIRVRERRAVAMLAMGGPLFLVSEDGTVFKELDESDAVDLPVITGVSRARFTGDRAFRASVVLEVVALLHDYRGAGLWRREPIAEVHIEEDDGLSLYIGEDALLVRLGRGPFREKLRRLRQILDRLKRRDARAEYIYLDNVRRPDRATVKLRPGHL